MLYDYLVTQNRDKFISKVQSVSDLLGINPDWLMTVMKMESGINHTAVNNNGGATGLIQFMPSTANGLGTSTSALLSMSNVDQLDYVYKYFRPYTGRLNSVTDLYMVTFFPIGLGKPDDWVLKSDTLSAELIAKSNTVFDLNKDLQITVGEFKTSIISRLPSDVSRNIVAEEAFDAKHLAELNKQTGEYSFKPTTSTIINQPKSTAQKNRIYTKFKHSIILDELSLPAEKNSGNYNIADDLSLMRPLVKINDFIFNEDELVSLTIETDDFLPRITLSLSILNDVFLSKEMPKDGDIISVAIRNSSDVLNMIRNDYVITNMIVATKSTSHKRPALITIFGELFVPYLRSQKNDFSVLGTSMDTMIAVAKNLNLGFATNEDDTNDKQIWIKANSSPISFINDVIVKAWKDNESFYDVWIDVYYNLNFVNMNKQLISSETLDMAVLIDNLNTKYMFGTKSKKDEAVSMPKVFSNFPDIINTSFYIDSWSPLNNSTAITFEIGAVLVGEMFEHNISLYRDVVSQKYWAIPIEPTYDSAKLDKFIILRGRSAQDSSTSGDDSKQANYSYREIYEKYPWLGIQYTIGDSTQPVEKWTGNHHKNYLRAAAQNLINLKELDKLNVSVNVTGTNLNLIKGEKVPVILMRTNVINNMLIDKNADPTESPDLFYSGWYIIKGFSIGWSKENNRSLKNGFSQSFVLTRREWPAPVEIESRKS